MDRIGCFFTTARSMADLRQRVLAAEELGYDIAGFPHIAGRDALTTLAAIGPATSRIRLATGIVPIYTRTPVTMAQEAGVVAEACGGRFMLGIGTGHAPLIENWHGTKFARPVDAMRDYLTILRSLFADANVAHDGPMYSSHFGFLGFRPQADLPILVGALGPRMVQLAGELADGVVLFLSNPHHIRTTVMPNLAIGAERTGRDVASLDVFACVFAAPGPDRSSARDAIRRQLFAYLQMPFYRSMLIGSGFSDDVHGYDAGIANGDLPQALAALSDAMIDGIAATGTQDEIAETLKAFVDAGVTTPGVGAVGGYEGYESHVASLQTLKSAGALVG
jgi:probable F420-dependent oxidoreductase